MSQGPVSLRLSCRLCAAGRGLAEYSGSSLLPSATSIISSDSGYGTFISEEPSRWDQRGRLLAAQRARSDVHVEPGRGQPLAAADQLVPGVDRRQPP